MKRLFINVLVLGLFIAVIFIIGSNTSWAFQSAHTQNTIINVDPNEPDPEILPLSQQVIVYDTDPNEPEPAPDPE